MRDAGDVERGEHVVQLILQGFEMKKPSIFPCLPKNLTIPELRKEIGRRLKISDQLGLIRKPKKVACCALPRAVTSCQKPLL